MKKLLLSLVAILAFNQLLAAQEERVAGRLFYAEAGGPGVIMSVNFDARFNSNERLGFGYRLGLGFSYGEVGGKLNQWGFYDYKRQTYYSVPVGLNYVFGKPDSEKTFEVGAGLTFLTHKVSLHYYNERKPGHVIGFLTFMYRIMPIDGGFSFRVGLTPIIGTSGDLVPMGAISFGYVF